MENKVKNQPIGEGSLVIRHLGSAEKCFPEMTKEEQNVVAVGIVAKAKEINFSHCLPTTYEKDGFIVQEYSGGRIIRLKPVETCSIFTDVA